jgi:hypothetical protein
VLQAVPKKGAATGKKPAAKKVKTVDPLFPSRPKSFRIGRNIQVRAACFALCVDCGGGAIGDGAQLEAAARVLLGGAVARGEQERWRSIGLELASCLSHWWWCGDERSRLPSLAQRQSSSTTSSMLSATTQ